MNSFCSLHGFYFANTTYDEIGSYIDSLASFQVISTLNPEIVVGLQKEPELKEFLIKNSLCVADGKGLVLAARFKKMKLNLITGVDLISFLLAQNKYSFYLVGSQPHVLEKMKQKFGSQIIGTQHGYFKPDEEPGILDDIRSKAPQVLLVALGFPKQERFLKRCSHVLSSGVGIGVGGAFDVLSGEKRRAPVWVQKMGMEWFYRGMREPRRMKRWIFIPKYIALLARKVH